MFIINFDCAFHYHEMENSGREFDWTQTLELWRVIDALARYCFYLFVEAVESGAFAFTLRSCFLMKECSISPLHVQPFYVSWN